MEIPGLGPMSRYDDGSYGSGAVRIPVLAGVAEYYQDVVYWLADDEVPVSIAGSRGCGTTSAWYARRHAPQSVPRRFARLGYGRPC